MFVSGKEQINKSGVASADGGCKWTHKNFVSSVGSNPTPLTKNN